MMRDEVVKTESGFGRRAGILAVMTAVAVAPVFADAPSITVNYDAFGTGVISEIQKMLTAILPAVAVLFGTMKGIQWVRAIL